MLPECNSSMLPECNSLANRIQEETLNVTVLEVVELVSGGDSATTHSQCCICHGVPAVFINGKFE